MSESLRAAMAFILPFEWASHGFMRNALAAILLLAPLLGALSTPRRVEPPRLFLRRDRPLSPHGRGARLHPRPRRASSRRPRLLASPRPRHGRPSKARPLGRRDGDRHRVLHSGRPRHRRTLEGGRLLALFGIPRGRYTLGEAGRPPSRPRPCPRRLGALDALLQQAASILGERGASRDREASRRPPSSTASPSPWPRSWPPRSSGRGSSSSTPCSPCPGRQRATSPGVRAPTIGSRWPSRSFPLWRASSSRITSTRLPARRWSSSARSAMRFRASRGGNRKGSRAVAG